MRTIAIYGSGTIGASWAGFFAAKGLSVRVFDASEKARVSGLKRGRELAAQLADGDESAAERIMLVADERALLDGADFIQESVLERYDVKRAVHESIERHVSPDAIIASSTSGLLASKMQEGLRHPGRFLIAHPFNPPHLIPLVELVGGPATDEGVLRRTYDFYSSLGKIPIVLKKEVPGHIANRLAVALWREAINLVATGAASLEDVDKALYAGPGLRYAFMGQHLIYHMAGGTGGYEHFFDHLGPQTETWLKDLATWDKIPADARTEVLAQMKASLAGKDPAVLERWRDLTLAKVVNTVYPSPVQSAK